MGSRHLRSDVDRHQYCPIFLDITGKDCLIVGGGQVAERKATMLLTFDASVRVISPKVTKRLARLAEMGRISMILREYTSGDHVGTAVIFACTDDRETNRLVREDAARERIPVNVVDRPRECDFIVPSIIRKGDVTIAISTLGLAPMASKRIRLAIEEKIIDDHAAYTRIIAAIRKYILTRVPDKNVRRRLMDMIGSMDTGEIIAQGITGMKRIVKNRMP